MTESELNAKLKAGQVEVLKTPQPQSTLPASLEQVLAWIRDYDPFLANLRNNGQTATAPDFDDIAPTTSKGDLVVHNGSANDRLPVGTDDQVLTADSAEPLGVKWADVAAGSAGASVACKVYATSPQVLVSNVDTEIEFGGETIDTDSMHDNVTDNTKIFIPSDGVYFIYGQVYYSAAGAANNTRNLIIRLNGTTELARAYDESIAAGADLTINTGALADLEAGDYIELVARISDGGSVNMDQDEPHTALNVFKLGGASSGSSGSSNKLDVSTNEVTFVDGDGGLGAGVATTVYQVSVPGGTLGADNALRFTARLRDVELLGVANDLTIEAFYGGESLGFIGTPALSGSGATDLKGFFEVYLLADGTGAQKATSTLRLEKASTRFEDDGDATVGITKIVATADPTATVDSTVSQDFELVVTMTNETENEAVLDWFILERIN